MQAFAFRKVKPRPKRFKRKSNVRKARLFVIRQDGRKDMPTLYQQEHDTVYVFKIPSFYLGVDGHQEFTLAHLGETTPEWESRISWDAIGVVRPEFHYVYVEITREEALKAVRP